MRWSRLRPRMCPASWSSSSRLPPHDQVSCYSTLATVLQYHCTVGVVGTWGDEMVKAAAPDVPSLMELKLNLLLSHDEVSCYSIRTCTV